MTSKKVTAKPVEKKAKPAKSKSEQYVESVLKSAGVLDKNKRNYYGGYDDNILESLDDSIINDCLYELPEDDVLKASKLLTEQSAFNILKKNKKVQEKIESILKNVAMHIVSETNGVSKSILQDRKYIEEDRKRQEKADKAAKAALEKNKDKFKAEQEKQKKLAAEKAMFKESLNSKQKQILKKLTGVDISKI